MLFRSVWIYKGEVIGSRSEREAAALAAARAPKPRRAPRAPRGEVTTSNVADREPETTATEAISAKIFFILISFYKSTHHHVVYIFNA